MRRYILLFALLVNFLFASFPYTMSYQGKLTDTEGYGINGTHTFLFSLYNRNEGEH
jgi:hypothetical protein